MGLIKGCIEAADVVTCPRELQQDDRGSSRRHRDGGVISPQEDAASGPWPLQWVTLTAAGQGRTFVTHLYSNHGRCKPIFSNSKSCIECSVWAYLVIKIQTHILGRFGMTQWHYFNAVVIKLRPCSPLGTRVGHVRGEAGLRNSLHCSPRVTCHDGQMLVQGYLNMLGNR